MIIYKTNKLLFKTISTLWQVLIIRARFVNFPYIPIYTSWIIIIFAHTSDRHAIQLLDPESDVKHLIMNVTSLRQTSVTLYYKGARWKRNCWNYFFLLFVFVANTNVWARNTTEYSAALNLWWPSWLTRRSWLLT